MKRTADEQFSDLVEAIRSCFRTARAGRQHPAHPDLPANPLLDPLLAEVEKLVSQDPIDKDAAGKAMERVALCVMRNLLGSSSRRSYRSVSSQHDLLVSGLSEAWLTLLRLMGAKPNAKAILVEAQGHEGGHRRPGLSSALLRCSSPFRFVRRVRDLFSP